jgi:hypothetical protein
MLFKKFRLHKKNRYKKQLLKNKKDSFTLINAYLLVVSQPQIAITAFSHLT